MAALLSSLSAADVSAESDDDPADPSARYLMENVRSRFPREEVLIEGDLRTRKRKGLDRQNLSVRMRLDLGRSPQNATYSILTDKGAPLEELNLIRNKGRPVAYTYKGAEGASELPSMITPIQKTNVSWSDLTLGFLWWPNGTIIGRETVRGQKCLIVKLLAPPGKASQYNYVKVWIDDTYNIMLKAQGFGPEDALIREMSVKSFKKIDDRWMIKDLDIRSMHSEHRTTLRVDAVSLPEKADREVDEVQP